MGSSGNNGCNCSIEKLLSTSFGSNTFIEKQKIINNGRPTPTLQDLKSKCKNNFRYFNPSYYNTDKWLSGCQKTQKLYCWPCIHMNQIIGLSIAVVNGVSRTFFMDGPQLLGSEWFYPSSFYNLIYLCFLIFILNY